MRQQGGGHLHKGHAAHVASSSKTSDVSDHTAAQGKQHGFAVAGLTQQHVKNQLQTFPGFVGLAIGQCAYMHFGVMRLQGGLQLRQIQRRHGVVGDDQGRRRFGQVSPSIRVGHESRRDADVITAVTQTNVHQASLGVVGNEAHAVGVSMGSRPASSSWLMIMVTMVGMRGRLVSMTKWAAAW